MQILNVLGAGTNYVHTWPDGSQEPYGVWIEYRALAPDGQHEIRICFGERPVYGQDRKRVLVLIDGRVIAEFVCWDSQAGTAAIWVGFVVAGLAIHLVNRLLTRSVRRH
jgi:hypothetical protein